jgi:regulator of chromosome condensation
MNLHVGRNFTNIRAGLSAVFVAAGVDDFIALTENGDAYSWGFSSDYRTG